MSNEEKSGSTSANSKSIKKKSERREQTCGRCRVHNVYIPLSGHKTYCRYKDCPCLDCQKHVQQQINSKQKIAIKRAKDLDAKKKLLPEEVSMAASALNSVYVLMDYTWKEMHNYPTAWYIPSKLCHIFAILIDYVHDVNEGNKGDLESTKERISKVIHDRIRDPFTMALPHDISTYCYLPPSRDMRVPDKRQPFVISSPQYPFHNLPIWSSNSLPMLTTSMSPFPENLIKPPTKPSTESFTDPSTVSSTEPSIEPSTESSTYYWPYTVASISHLLQYMPVIINRSLTISEVNRRGKQVESKENCVASEVIKRLFG